MLSLEGRQVERRTDISSALILWLEHASLHGERSNTMIYSRDNHDARNVRWLCECLLPLYGGTISADRWTWSLPNGARLHVNFLLDDEDLVGHGGHALTMVIAVNAPKWPVELLHYFSSMLRSPHAIPTRYITTGEL